MRTGGPGGGGAADALGGVSASLGGGGEGLGGGAGAEAMSVAEMARVERHRRRRDRLRERLAARETSMVCTTIFACPQGYKVCWHQGTLLMAAVTALMAIT